MASSGWKLLALVSGIIAGVLDPAVLADLDPGWAAGLNNDFNLSADLLETEFDADPEDPVAAFSFAASLLCRQPLTQDNVRRSLEICETIASGFGPDDLRLRARYMVARINHAHLKPRRLVAAEETYRQILDNHPGDPLAELAGIKLAVILVDRNPEGDPGALLDELEAISARLPTPLARCELHFSRAMVYLDRLGDKDAALDQFLAARREGFANPESDAGLDVLIGVLAQELGREDVALRHYRQYVDARPNDMRTGTVRRLIREREEAP